MTKLIDTKASRRAVLAGAAGLAGMVAMPAVLRAQTVKWIGASATPQTDFIAQGLDFFAARVKELTKGQIEIATHHAGSLGGEREHVEGLLSGAVHVASPGAAILGGWYKPAEGLDLPLPVQERRPQGQGDDLSEWRSNLLLNGWLSSMRLFRLIGDCFGRKYIAFATT